jgi:hypothetical protein
MGSGLPRCLRPHKTPLTAGERNEVTAAYTAGMALFRKSLAAAYRMEGDTVLVELKLREARQLFNSFDPAPFIEKDLDDDAEAYIIDAVREVRAHRPKKLVMYLPGETVASEDARAIPRAIHAYFTYRAEHAGLQLHHTLREGVVSLGIGLSFLVLCLVLRESLEASSAMNRVIDEGLLIMGWVAMWRPIDTFLYDWWPIRSHRTLLEEIAHMPIEVRAR